MSSHPTADAIVLGAGLTGLSTAVLLQKRGLNARVLEHTDRPGGAVQTLHESGYTVEAGPNTLMLKDSWLENFLHDLGLKDSLVEANPEAKKRYIVRRGVPVPVPVGPMQALTSPLFSNRALFRVLLEGLQSAPTGEEDRSLADWVRQHFGREILDYAVNPFVSGIYAGDPGQLSMRHTFPMLAEMERLGHGSVLRGAFRWKKKRRSSGPAHRSRMVSFQGGLQTLTDSLASHLGDALQMGITLQRIRRDPGEWTVDCHRPGQSEPQSVSAPHLVLSIPAHAIPDLPWDASCRDAFSCLQDIDYPPVTSVALGFSRNTVAHPLDGFGMLVPAVENRSILGTLFSSTLFPDRAPDGSVLLTTFIGGARNPDLAALPDADLQKTIQSDLADLLGVRGDPVYSRITRWHRAIPQYSVGYARFLQAMDRWEAEYPGLHFGGHYRDGIALPQCMQAGARLADAIQQGAH